MWDVCNCKLMQYPHAKAHMNKELRIENLKKKWEGIKG